MKCFLAAHDAEIKRAMMNARVGDMIEIKTHSRGRRAFPPVRLIVGWGGQLDPAGKAQGRIIESWEATPDGK